MVQPPSDLACGYSTDVLGQRARLELDSVRSSRLDQDLQLDLVRIKEMGAGSTSAEVARSCDAVTRFKALAVQGVCGGASQFENNFKTKLKL